ncbi:MAG: hypothetical protein KF787_10895 [Phycisphaeraceae bacterium]|nr:hypothetical protein [Phycisphaerae bacterium]MBX3393142.1 hypothetical protein [Phycisphaeraceae bacterium]HRJ49125.1 hypothetical protein [Phycisphaerales bacterium]
MTHDSIAGTGRARGGVWVTGVVMAVIGGAGLLKAMDLPVFLDTVETWTLLGPVTRWTAVIGLPPAEMGMAVLWFAGVRRARLEAAAASLLMVFGLTYGLHLLLAKPPSCGCFGLVDEYFKSLSEGRGALWRHGILLALLVTGSWLTRRAPGAVNQPTRLPRERTMSHAIQ